MNSLTSTRIVLQGEMSCAQATPENDCFIKTTKPTSCHILTLYSRKYKIGVLAHIDDYTSVRHAFAKIVETLKYHFHKPIGAYQFEAKLLGGCADEYSLKQKKNINHILEVLRIPVEKIPLQDEMVLKVRKEKRPQVILNLSNGELNLIEGNRIDYQLEYLQYREYGEWNNILDFKYGSLAGDKIPYFEIKEAARFEKDIVDVGADDSPDSIQKAQIRESCGMLELPIQAQRSEFNENSDELDIDPEVILNKIVLTLSKEFKPLLNCLKSKDYNRLLRQSATDSKCIDLLNTLLEYDTFFGIDIHSRGEKSGSAMDLAVKNENQLAIEAIKKYQLQKVLQHIEAMIIDSQALIFKSLNKAFVERNFNLMLRQCAYEPRCLELLQLLINHTQLLDIDIHSRGRKSGTALELAQKSNNQAAIEMLKLQFN